MAWVNDIKDVPYKDDEVLDVQFKYGIGMLTLIFKSGKRLIVHINDDGSFSRKDYMNQIKINNRNITIDKLTDE